MRIPGVQRSRARSGSCYLSSMGRAGRPMDVATGAMPSRDGKDCAKHGRAAAGLRMCLRLARPSRARGAIMRVRHSDSRGSPPEDVLSDVGTDALCLRASTFDCGHVAP